MITITRSRSRPLGRWTPLIPFEEVFNGQTSAYAPGHVYDFTEVNRDAIMRRADAGEVDVLIPMESN